MEEKLYWGLGPLLGPFTAMVNELRIPDCAIRKIILTTLLQLV